MKKFINLTDLAGWFRNGILIVYLICAGCGGGGSSSGSVERYNGSDEFKAQMEQAESKYRASGVRSIVEGTTANNFLASYNESQKKITFSGQWRNYENDDLASVLAHENTHAFQATAKSHDQAIINEIEAFDNQVRFLMQIGRSDLAGKWAAYDGTHVCVDW